MILIADFVLGLEEITPKFYGLESLPPVSVFVSFVLCERVSVRLFPTSFHPAVPCLGLFGGVLGVLFLRIYIQIPIATKTRKANAPTTPPTIPPIVPEDRHAIDVRVVVATIPV